VAHTQAQKGPASPIPDAAITVSIADAIVGKGNPVARVPVTLSIPATHTIVVEYATQDGVGTFGALPGNSSTGAHFVTTRGQLIFQPGEQNKVAAIQLLRPLDDTQSIGLQIADFGYPRRTYARRIGWITAGEGEPLRPSTVDDAIELPPVPAGGSVVFSDDLRAADFASDSGFRSDGRPCWQSRLARSRQQVGNKELGYYADPALNHEAKVWGIDPDTGCRFIQAEYIPGGLSDGKGGKLSLAWKKDTPFTYSAAMVTSRTLFNRITTGSYVEFEVRLTNIQGSWPALWLMAANDTWPPEIDILEAFISTSDYRPDVITSSIHWRGEKEHEAYGASVPLRQFEQGADIFARFNRFGCFIGEKQITYYFNGEPYCGMPNLVGAGPWYMLMDVAVGGLVREPSDPSAFPAPLHIAGVKVFQFS
jgi:hypothetical protein